MCIRSVTTCNIRSGGLVSAKDFGAKGIPETNMVSLSYCSEHTLNPRINDKKSDRDNEIRDYRDGCGLF